MLRRPYCILTRDPRSTGGIRTKIFRGAAVGCLETATDDEFTAESRTVRYAA